MARTDTLPHFLTDVADAIRTKTGSSGTITASDFDTEITNIPSGGIPIPTNNTEFSNLQQQLIQNYNSYINSLLDNYEVIIDNNITLYTPDINCNHYMIQKRNNGNYRIVWTVAPYIRIISNSSQAVQGYTIDNPLKRANALSQLNTYYLSSPTSPGDFQVTNIYSYYSSEFATLNELIVAISDITQSRNITYYNWSSGTSFSGIIDDTFPTPITNCVVFDNNDNPISSGKTISHNETYIVIS